MLAFKIAVAWLLLSFLTAGSWILVLEAGRLFTSKPASKPPGWRRRN